jgi:hypothetical protein
MYHDYVSHQTLIHAAAGKGIGRDDTAAAPITIQVEIPEKGTF